MDIDSTDQYRHEDDTSQCPCDEIFQSVVFLWMDNSGFRIGSCRLFVVVVGFRLLFGRLLVGFLLELQDLL